MIPSGTTITLQLEIDPEISYPTNNVGPNNVECYPPSNPIHTSMNYLVEPFKLYSVLFYSC